MDVSTTTAFDGATNEEQSTTTTSSGDPETATMGDVTTTTTGDCLQVSIVGEWLSEGENIAPLLADLAMIESIQAIFEDATFEINYTDTKGDTFQQTGTWTSELCPGSETKHRIVLEETTPSASTYEGIYEIDGCMMRYDVIQTQPDVGSVALICEDDFGEGTFGKGNIHVYVRQSP